MSLVSNGQYGFRLSLCRLLFAGFGGYRKEVIRRDAQVLTYTGERFEIRLSCASFIFAVCGWFNAKKVRKLLR
jgi:hypothetical protein